jgi:hypothetical protein
MHDLLLLKAHDQKIDQQKDDDQIMLLREENQSLKNTIQKQNLLTNEIQSLREVISTCKIVERKDGLQEMESCNLCIKDVKAVLQGGHQQHLEGKKESILDEYSCNWEDAEVVYA